VRGTWRYKALSIGLGVSVVASIALFALQPDRNALWSIVQSRCLADDTLTDGLPPCTKVERQQGYVMIKDRKGSHHFLLLPIDKISGIEDPLLLQPSSPNYFGLAWDDRGALSFTDDIGDDEVLLAVNSEHGRSQDQLHVHISCTRRDVRQILLERESDISDTWQILGAELVNHVYWARRVTMDQFRQLGPFRLLAYGLPRSASDMGRFSVAVTVLNGDVILLATERNLFDLNFASSEELQDHECTSAGR
jgi:CDP-diacylglycerol pyrophosphatase